MTDSAGRRPPRAATLFATLAALLAGLGPATPAHAQERPGSGVESGLEADQDALRREQGQGLPRERAEPDNESDNESDNERGDAFRSWIPGRPLASLRVLYTARGDFTDRNDPATGRGSLATTTVRASLNGVPVLLRERIKLFVGLNAERTELDFEDTPGINDLRLYRLGLPVVTLLQLSEDWSLRLITSPLIASDFKQVDRDDFGMFAVAAVGYRATERLKLQVGVVALTGFGRSLIVPSFGLTWDLDESWRLRLQAPSPAIIWAPTEDLSISAEMAFLPGSANIRRDDLAGRDTSFYVDRDGFLFGVSADVHVAGPLWVRGGVGWAVGQRLIIRRAGRRLVDAPVESTLSFGFELLWRRER